ncbi:hypothetical protein M426DRAFT_22150 [Hypoxylon sp. CI-4A]|nr:hypothetical protein M426DRAFT_22150 [Hypoxylon sp. CI-4A]
MNIRPDSSVFGVMESERTSALCSASRDGKAPEPARRKDGGEAGNRRQMCEMCEICERGTRLRGEVRPAEAVRELTDSKGNKDNNNNQRNGGNAHYRRSERRLKWNKRDPFMEVNVDEFLIGISRISPSHFFACGAPAYSLDGYSVSCIWQIDTCTPKAHVVYSTPARKRIYLGKYAFLFYLLDGVSCLFGYFDQVYVSLEMPRILHG